MDNGSLIVVALGGNAISRPDQVGNVAEQFENSRATACSLADLIGEGHRLVITHGNGPQIGNFLVRNKAAAGVIYPLSMEVAVAHVQGGMGYMIAQAVMNELVQRGDNRTVTAVVTSVLVDADDPSFANPTKPIGRHLSTDDAERLACEEQWQTAEVSPGTYRRVVPSPLPIGILEIESIRRAVQAGETLVVCGGGGIPVVRDDRGAMHGVRAVVDKDFASARLAAELNADLLMILTNVDGVCLDFGTPKERHLDHMTLAEAKQWLDDGQFPAGSMGPKIQGAINFLEASTQENPHAIIGSLTHSASSKNANAQRRFSPAIAAHIGTCIGRET